MTDFGANIFDKDPPEEPRRREPRDERRPVPPAPVTPPPARPTSADRGGRAPSQRDQGQRDPGPRGASEPESTMADQVPTQAPDAKEPRRDDPRDRRWQERPRHRDERERPAPPDDRGPRDSRPPHRPHSGAPRHEDPVRAPVEPRHEARPERHTEFRSATSEPREPNRSPERSPREAVRRLDRAGPLEEVATSSVAVLVDLEGLQAEARAQQGELSMHRLRSGLGGNRKVIRAMAIAKTSGTPPSGFELTVVTGGFAAGVSFSAAAIELLRTAPALVMAPPSEPIQMLADTLRAAGHTVELAGFGEPAEGTFRQLGRDCLFIP